MNFSPRDLKKLLDEGDIDLIKWRIYFAKVLDTILPTCEDCRDKKNGSCLEEGGNPIECFLYGPNSRPDGILLKDIREDGSNKLTGLRKENQG